MKNTYAMNELVFFKTRREARAYAVASGKNTAQIVDRGTDKAIGERWAAVKVVSVAVTPVMPVKTLVLGTRRNRAETMTTGRSNGTIHDVKVYTKRSFNRVGA